MLRKSLWGDARTFLGPLMRFVCGDVRDLIVSYKKRPRPFVSALQSVAAVEASKNQLLRDFRYRSILDFCNNICQQRTFTNAPAQARPFEGASISTSASVHPRRAGWGDVRIHLRVRSAGAAAARAATAFSDGSRQPGGHGWIWRIPQRFTAERSATHTGRIPSAPAAEP